MKNIIEKADVYLADVERGEFDIHSISWFATNALSGSDIPFNSDLGYELAMLANMALGPEYLLGRNQLILTLNRLKYWAAAQETPAKDRSAG